MSSIIPGTIVGRSLRMSAFLFILAGIFQLLRAQTGTLSGKGLDVNVGDAFEYEGIGQFTIDMDVLGKTQNFSEEMGTLQVLEVKSISEDEIYWELAMVVAVDGGGSTATSGLLRSNGPMTIPLYTDRLGQPQSVNVEGNESEDWWQKISGLLSGLTNNNSIQGPGWVAPPDLQGRKVGESWVVPILDTTDFGFPGTMDLNVVVELTTTYTYGGIVDTLGVQAARLSWHYDSLRISGTMSITSGFQETRVTMRGIGTSSGVAWYSLSDQMKLAQISDGKMRMNAEINVADETEEAKSLEVNVDTHNELSRQE